MSNDFLWYVMLISLILPSILNFFWLSWKIGMKKGLSDGLFGGLLWTVMGQLGIHDLFSTIE